jgi:hypothetical protein
MKKEVRKLLRTCALALFLVILPFGATGALGADMEPPTCQVTVQPDAFTDVEFRIQDTGSGLSAINVIEAENATVIINPFAPGVINTIRVSVSKIDKAKSFRVVLESVDMAGNASQCQYPALVDQEPPVCELSVEDVGPPLRVEFTISDNESGLDSIEVTQSENANISYPPFGPGVTDPVIVTVTKADENQDLIVVLEVTDTAGNSSMCQYVSTVDDEGPVCELTAEDMGPPFFVEFTVHDSDGLSAINIIRSHNATVFIPPFPPGIVSPGVVVTATKIDENQDLILELEAVDMAGNTSTCRYPLADTEPPRCELTEESTGPPYSIEVTIQDMDSGLNSIRALEITNADVVIPSFAQGTTEPVVVTITRIDESRDLSVLLEAVDMEGNVRECTHPIPLAVNTHPEFDLVGTDSHICFEDYRTNQIVEFSTDSEGKRINDFSNFPSEHFQSPAGPLLPDPCFSQGSDPYLSALAPAWTETSYAWQIVLQMKPAGDIHLDLVGCVLKQGEVDAWKAAEQTGRYRLPWGGGEVFFVWSANPSLTVLALPGPYATAGFPAEGFYLDARRVPGLDLDTLVETAFTSQALVEEGIVIALPKTGATNAYGQTTYELKQGDRIRVEVGVPGNNLVDIRYGSHNAILRYIGIVGSEYITGM